LAGSTNRGCLAVVIAAFALDALIAAIIVLFVNGNWQWATGIACFVAAILAIGAVIIKWRSLNYCPECGKRLSPIMEGKGGSHCKECLNPACKARLIS